MVLLGIPLDVVAFLLLVMSVGLAVDYVIHITHSVAEVKQEDVRKQEDRDRHYNRMAAGAPRGAVARLAARRRRRRGGAGPVRQARARP